jgi:hypothetical protein
LASRNSCKGGRLYLYFLSRKTPALSTSRSFVCVIPWNFAGALDRDMITLRETLFISPTRGLSLDIRR